jgi:hypothetical protein
VLKVDVRQDPELGFGVPEVAFDLGDGFTYPSNYYWDIGKDGRYLGWREPEPYEYPTEIRVVLNWFERLEELVPTEEGGL